MAFTASTLTCMRGGAGSAPSVLNKTSHTYFSSTDTVATIFGGGYFPVDFGLAAGLIRIGDLIDIIGTDTVAPGRITAVSPVAITQFSSITTTVTTQSNTYDGVWAAPIATTFTYLLKDYGSFKEVSVICPEASANATTSAIISAGTALLYLPATTPVGFTTYAAGIPAADNNAYTAAGVYVFSSGALEIHKTPGNVFSGLSGSGQTGFGAFTLTYRTL